MTCILVTALMYYSYYSLLASFRSHGLLHRILTASVMTCSQIVMTELSLGLLHALSLSSVIAVNAPLALGIILIGTRIRVHNNRLDIRTDLRIIGQRVAAALDGYTLSLAVLAVIAYAWILVAAYFLPPRGIDDLIYHLPAIYEYIQSHAISLLPVVKGQNFLPDAIRGNFAFPENAELLFMWPVLFSHTQQFVDALNVPVVFLSVLALYALCRHFGISGRDSLFAGLLYAFTPVVLMQAGCTYVDVLVVLMLLLSMYYSLRFHGEGRELDLLAAGMSIGLMCGMKYTSLPLALLLQVLIVPRLLSVKPRYATGYVLLILLLAGWWYLRNALVLGDPFFPMGQHASSVDGHASSAADTVLHNIMANLKSWVLLFPFQDIGIGSHDGGFGMVFWGIGFPSWIVVTLAALYRIRRTGLQKLVVFAYLPFGFFLLLMLPTDFVIWDARLGLVVVPVGLFALTELLRILRDRGMTGVIKTACVLMSAAAFCLLFTAEKPTYLLGDAIADARNAREETSEYKYLNNHPFTPYTSLRYVWEPLDYLTRNKPDGLSCTIATENGIMCMTAPLYGSRLQNRVLNFKSREDGWSDVYVYTHTGKNMFRPTALPGDVRLNKSTTVQELMADDGYLVVTQTDIGVLLMRREFIERPEQQRMLRAYYRKTWSEAAAAAEQLDPRLNPSIPLVTSEDLGYGVRARDMDGTRKNRVYLTLENQEEVVAARKGLHLCYTFRRPLHGYQSRKVSEIPYHDETVAVYFNSRGR